MQPKNLLIIIKIALIVAGLSSAVTFLRFLPNHTRNVIAFTLFTISWLMAIVVMPLALANHRKNKDYASKITVWLGAGIIILPVLIWVVAAIGIGNGLN